MYYYVTIIYWNFIFIVRKYEFARLDETNIGNFTAVKEFWYEVSKYEYNLHESFSVMIFYSRLDLLLLRQLPLSGGGGVCQAPSSTRGFKASLLWSSKLRRPTLCIHLDGNQNCDDWQTLLKGTRQSNLLGFNRKSLWKKREKRVYVLLYRSSNAVQVYVHGLKFLWKIYEK